MPESKNESEIRAPFARFGEFEVDLRSHEVRTGGRLVRLQGQPFRILEALLEQPGQLVTREELQLRLWSEDTHVDFERGLGSAVRKLREALNDRARKPRFVETVSGRGFRFIAPVQRTSDSGSATEEPMRAFRVVPKRGALLAAVILGLVVGGVTLVYRGGPSGRASLGSVVVLPLDNLSEDPDQEYFADGMTDALIHRLARIDSLGVVSLTTAMRYKESSRSRRQIAQELNVDAVLEGSVEHSGGRVRVTVQLIEGERDIQLWSESFDYADEEVLTLQSEVALAVARRMRVTMSPENDGELGDALRVKPAAYEDFLRAKFFLSQTGTSAHRRAVTYFARSIEAEPNFAPAHAGLSLAYNLRGREKPAAAGDLREKARASALRAVELDNELAAAHASLGYVKMYDLDWQGAERSFERAVSLDSQDEVVWGFYQNFLVRMRRFEEARHVLEKARVLNPLSPMILNGLARLDLLEHQPDHATELCRQHMELEPKGFMQHYCLGLAELDKGNYPEAIGELRRALDLGGRSPLLVAVLSYTHAVAGHTEAAQSLQQELMESSAKGYPVSAAIGMTCIGLGEPEEAIDWLERGYEQKDPLMLDLNYYPLFESLRSHPRYQELLRRMKFTP